MLKIERTPSYLSPSSLMMAENMPNTFYLTRLVLDPMLGVPQPLNAAVGSAFDYYIKVKLVEDRFPHKAAYLPEIKKGIETNIDEAFSAGKKAFNSYIERAYNKDEYADIEIHNNGSFEEVPITGKLDAKILDQETNLTIPFDWKMSGYTSKTGISPEQGYYRLWDGLRPKAAHKIYSTNILMNHINERWAFQTCTYGWLLGLPMYKPFPTRIDQICWRNGTVRTALYRGWITEEYQREVIMRYKKVWNSLLDGSYINNLASSRDPDLVWIAAKNESWFIESNLTGII